MSFRIVSSRRMDSSKSESRASAASLVCSKSASMEDGIDGIDRFIDPESSRIAWLKSLERRDRKNYFPSGFETQDKAIGAFERGALNSIGGFTGKGKTSFLTSMAYQMIRKHGTRVYYCNFEMSSASMWNRLACIHDPNL